MGISRKPDGPAPENQKDPLLELRQLSKYYFVKGGLWQRTVGEVRAVDQITLAVLPGETVTLAGQTSAGKTTLARLVQQLVKPTAGTILFRGADLARLGRAARQQVRQQLQMTLQDPYTALNPNMMVADILAEPLQIHKLTNGRSQKETVAHLLQMVGLNPYFAGRYPHEFSGSQRQRISLARALATQPELLVIDDPLLALDTAVRPYFISLLRQLKERLNLTLLLLVSELAHVRQISDRVGVLFMGELVELGATPQMYERPLHPYTQFLHSQTRQILPANPHIQPIQLTGPAPDPTNLPDGCRFHPQCPYANDTCQNWVPVLRNLGTSTQPHLVSCHHAERFQD